MNIIDKLGQQLSLIKNNLEIELKRQEYRHDYHILGNKNIFLNIFQLRSYLTVTEIKNTIFLKKINKLCIEISRIFNNELYNLKKKTLPKSNNKLLDFHLLIIGDNGITREYLSYTEHRFANKNNLPKIVDFYWISERCDEILETITDAYPDTTINQIIKSETKFAWFEVGLLFASGEMNKLINTFNRNATKIAQFKFGEKWTKYRPYISESINNTTKSSKNIFANNSKLEKIKEYCLANKIAITENFKNKIKHI